MNIVAEDIEKARAFLPGLFKFDENEPFKQALIALNDAYIFIYNDNAPDAINGDDWNYSVKYRFPLSDIKMVVNEKISKQPLLEGLFRLAIHTQKIKDPFYFYYYNNDKKTYSNFIAGLKFFGVTVETHHIELIVEEN